MRMNFDFLNTYISFQYFVIAVMTIIFIYRCKYLIIYDLPILEVYKCKRKCFMNNFK